MTRLARLMLMLSLGPLAAGCDDYNPPPEAELVQPSEGLWTKSTPLELKFSEPFENDSLVITIWPNDLDSEGELRPEVKPVIDACTLASSPCGDFEMTLDDTGTLVIIEVNDTFNEREGVPHILEIHKGLRDSAGRERKVRSWYDFQINPTIIGGPVDIQLSTGVLSMTASLGDVVPGVFLRMFLDFAIDNDTGVFIVLGTFSRLEQRDPPLEPNYAEPDGFAAVLDDEGWAIVMRGFIIEQDDGEYFFQSDPFDVDISLLGGVIPLTLDQFQVQGTIIPATVEGERDFASGTMSTQAGRFDPGTGPVEVDAITAAWEGKSFIQSEIPAGLPTVCGDPECGVLRENGGDCQTGDQWDPGAVCE